MTSSIVSGNDGRANVLEIIATRQWPNPTQVLVSLLIRNEVRANHCLTSNLLLDQAGENLREHTQVHTALGLMSIKNTKEIAEPNRESLKMVLQSMTELSCSRHSLQPWLLRQWR